jgi:hypothetical protein
LWSIGGTLSGMAISVPSPRELEAMSATQQQVYENQVRRLAQRQGLRLTKNLLRGCRPFECGKYYLVRVEDAGSNPYGKSLVTSEYGVSLIDIHRMLIGEQTTS